jgi:hypothetical protein
MAEITAPVSISSLGGGAAVQLFQVELQKVLDNIVDENTKPDAMREVTLKVKIKPDPDRDYAQVAISCTSKLAPMAPFGTNFFIGKQRGKGVAQEHNPKQKGLFAEPESPVSVVPKQQEG